MAPHSFLPGKTNGNEEVQRNLPRYGFGFKTVREEYKIFNSVIKYEYYAQKTSSQTCSNLVSLFSNELLLFANLGHAWMATAVLALTRVDIINYWPNLPS